MKHIGRLPQREVPVEQELSVHLGTLALLDV